MLFFSLGTYSVFVCIQTHTTQNQLDDGDSSFRGNITNVCILKHYFN